MPTLPLTNFDALSQFVTAATSRSVFLVATNDFLMSNNLIGRACEVASLTDLAERFRSEDPLAHAEALHRIAASEELRSRIAARLGEPERAMLQAQSARLQGLVRGQGLSGFKILFFGDIHDHWGPVRRIVRHEFPDGDGVVLAVGDLETYKTIPTRLPLLFSHGNHDDEKQLTEIRGRPEPAWGRPYPLLAGEFALIQGGLVVGAFSGIYEREFFEGRSNVFPYFSREDVARAMQMPLPPDIFLSHEAPAGVGLVKEGRDLGSAVVTGLLERLQPKVAFFGHHHYEFDGHLGKTRIIGLDYPKRSYVTATVDGISGELRFERHRSKLVEKGGTRVYQYDWERDGDAHEKRDRERLFSVGMPTLMNREEQTAEMLDKKFRDRLKERLLPVFLPRVGNEGDTERTRRLLAEGLANGVFNTVLPYFARYYVSLKASLSMKEKDLLKKGILQQMLKDKTSVSFAHDDLALAFNALSEFVDQD